MIASPQKKPENIVHTLEQNSVQQPVYYMPAQYPEADDEINLLDYWRILMRYKWLIILLTLIGGGSAISTALQMTPVYRAEVLLAPAAEDKSSASALAGQFGGLAALAGISLGAGGGKVEEAIATLQSRIFTNEFIREENLMPVLFSDIWDAENKKWLLESPADKPTVLKAFKTFDSIRSISDDKKTGMYTLAFEWHDPAQVAVWANQMVERINKHQKDSAIIEANKSIKYLENQLQETSDVEMRQSIFRLIEAQTKNIMLANVRDEFAFKVIDPAVVPEETIKPKKKLMAVLGVMVGFMFGVFLAFFLAFIKKQKEDKQTEVKQAAVTPVKNNEGN